jgi:hypothetical protein
MVYAKQGLKQIVYQCMMMILAFDTLFFVSGAQANSENVTARDILQRALETVKNRPPMMADGEVHSKYDSHDKERKLVSRVYISNQQHDTTREMWELKDDKWVKLHEYRGIWDGSRYTARHRREEEAYENEFGNFLPGDFSVTYDDEPRTVGWATQLYNLWGTTWRGKHFAEEMLESETFLRTEMEQVDGFDCYVVEGDTWKGHKTVWIDPKHGYLHRKMICEGDPNNPDNLRGIEIIDTKIEYLEGIPVVTEAERHFFPKFIDENRPGATKATLTQHEKMSNVVWNPDFEAMGAFKMDKVPNGTRVIYRANDLHKTGVKFHWQDGRIVQNVDEEDIKQIDRITEELMAEGQVSTGLEAAKKNDAAANKPSATLDERSGTAEAQREVLSESRPFLMLVFVLIGLSIIAIIAWRVFLLKKE